MELEGISNGESSMEFLERLWERQSGRLNVIWDNTPAHRSEAVREWLRMPGLGLRLVNLPGHSPDFNAYEAIWGWAEGDRKPAPGDQSLGATEGQPPPRRAGQPEG